MSRGYASDLKTLSADASADLSSYQYHFVTLGASGLALAATRGEEVEGVLQDKPDAANLAGSFGYAGVTPVMCGGTFAAGDPLTNDANGHAIKATLLSDVIHGKAVEIGASGAKASMIVGVAGGYLAAPGGTIVEDLSGYLVTDLPTQYALDGTIGTGTAGDLNVISLMSGTKLGLWVIGTQTIVAPVVLAGGLDISYDQTDNDGIELFTNTFPASGAPLTVGADAYRFTCALNIADVSGTDMLFCGFRLRENAYQTAMTGYDTYFGLGSTTEANPMALYVREELNGGAGAETDTTDTQADGVTLWVQVDVSTAGVATVKHADTRAALATPSVTSTFTFDAGDSIVPTLRILQANATQTGVVKLIHWEAGPQV